MKLVFVSYIDHGLGFTSRRLDGSWSVEINRNLLKGEYKELLDHVVKHEMMHVRNNGNIIKDLWLDLIDNFNLNKRFQILKFVIKYPKAMIGDLPIFINKKKIYINPYSSLMCLIIVVGIIYLFAIVP